MRVKVFEALASGDNLELRMYGPVGGGFFSDGISAQMVGDALAANPNAKRITCKINSPGGAAYEGMQIRAMLAGHPGKVTCEIEGLAASAASIIAMAGDSIRMHEGAAMMIHEASTVTRGNAADHAKTISALTTLNDGLASIYASRSGMSKEECAKLMAAETWMTPEQAVAKNLADEVIKGKSKATAEVTASFDLQAFGYQHVPPHIADAAAQARVQQLFASIQPRTSATAVTTITAPVPAPVPEIRLMSFARIATALGIDSASDEAAVTSALAKLQARVNSADERTASLDATLTELRTLTATTSTDGMLGAIRGFAEAAKQVPELKAQLETQSKAIDEQRRTALITADANDPKGRKLTPAMVTFWSARPVAELEAFLAVAPHIVVAQSSATSQPAVTTVGAAAISGTTEIVTHEGKSWEQMTPAEKHNLFVDAPETFKALRANHAERGSPRAQPPQAQA